MKLKIIKNHIEKRAKDIDSSQKSYAMALHHIKGSSNWLKIRETQWKPPWDILTFVRLTKNKILTSHSVGKAVGEQAFLCIAVGSKNSSTPMKRDFTMSRLHMHLLFDPVISLLVAIYPEDTCSQMQNNAV